MTDLLSTPMMVMNNINTLIDQLQNIKAQIEEWLSNAPEGVLKNYMDKKSMRYVLVIDKKSKSLSNDKETIKLYLHKRYYKKVLKILNEGIPNIKSVAKNYLDLRREIQNEYTNLHEEIKSQIAPIDMSNEELAKRWYAVPYVGLNVDETSDFFTTLGEHVRSKSEVEIANYLYLHGLFYKYECPLVLSPQVTYYPDFTIWDPVMRCEVYWEHFGKMSDADYSKKAARKMKNYLLSKLFLGKKFIFTMEFDGFPLGTTEIRLTYEAFFDHSDAE